MWNTNVYIYITKTLVFSVTMPQIIDNRNADLWGSICCYSVKLWNQHSNCHWFVMPWYSCRVPVLTVNFVCCFAGNAAEKQTVRVVLPPAMALMWRHCNGNAVKSHLMRSGIIYSIWLCGQIENVDVYFSWPENTLEQTADQAVILDPPLLSYFWQNCVEVVP